MEKMKKKNCEKYRQQVVVGCSVPHCAILGCTELYWAIGADWAMGAEGAEWAMGSEGVMGAEEDKEAAIYLILDG